MISDLGLAQSSRKDSKVVSERAGTPGRADVRTFRLKPDDSIWPRPQILRERVQAWTVCSDFGQKHSEGSSSPVALHKNKVFPPANVCIYRLFLGLSYTLNQSGAASRTSSNPTPDVHVSVSTWEVQKGVWGRWRQLGSFSPTRGAPPLSPAPLSSARLLQDNEPQS